MPLIGLIEAIAINSTFHMAHILLYSRNFPAHDISIINAIVVLLMDYILCFLWRLKFL